MWRICRWLGTWKTVHLDRGQNKQTNKEYGMFSARVVIVSLGNKTKVKKMRRKQNKHGTKIYGAEQHQGSLAAVMGQDC